MKLDVAYLLPKMYIETAKSDRQVMDLSNQVSEGLIFE